VDDYVKYLTNNQQSLLARIIKAFTVRTLDFDINDGYLLMECIRPAGKHIAFDVKGSL
jgi:hypothetical protein